MPKVLILTGDAAEALEVIYPHQRLREEGYEVVVAGLSRKLLQLVVHEMVPGKRHFCGKAGLPLAGRSRFFGSRSRRNMWPS